ncbi:MAG: hypothetical protein ACE5OZ_01290 [Candidatus Heimdallarchaeota archaeon]
MGLRLDSQNKDETLPKAHNETAKDQLRVFVIAAINQFRQLIAEGVPVPVSPWPKTRFSKFAETNLNFRHEVELDWYIFIVKYWDSHIEKLAEAKSCVREMQRDQIINKHFGQLVGSVIGGQTSHSLGDYLRQFLCFMIVEVGDFVFKENVFNRLYAKMEHFFYSETLKYRILAPISGFRAVREIELGEGIKIAPISHTTLEKLTSQFGLSGRMHQSLMTHTLEILHEESKLIGAGALAPASRKAESPFPVIDKVISALITFKAGSVSYNYVYILPLGWLVSGTSRISFGRSSWSSSKIGYTLADADIPAFQSFWREFKGYPDNRDYRPLNIAIRRLNYAAERTRAEDKLIDYMIGLEALFLNQDQELRYKLALRVAAYLNSNRSDTFQAVYAAYGLRNKLVHGSKQVDIDQALSEKIDDYLRKAIKLYAMALKRKEGRTEKKEKGNLKKEIINALDDRIVRYFSHQREHSPDTGNE